MLPVLKEEKINFCALSWPPMWQLTTKITDLTLILSLNTEVEDEVFLSHNLTHNCDF